MEGIPILKQAIRAEWNLGLGRLPASEFSALLRPKLSDILSKSEESLKLWFLTVRQGRILFDTGNIIADEFTDSKALQKWIGLSYTLEDAEAIPILQQAIDHEITTGLGNLPKRQFQKLFTTNYLPTSTSTLQNRKNWFTVVRQGRKLYDKRNLKQDEFTLFELYQQWLETIH